MTTEPLPPTAPIEIPTNPRLRDAFTALSVRNYRRYALGLALGNTAGWAQRVAIDWLVLELTGNIALVGLTIAVQFAPAVALGVFGGVVADRLPRRGLIVATQFVIGGFSAALAALALTGEASLLLVYALVFGIGVAQAFEAPARSAFAGELSGPTRLRSAVSLNASIFHLGALIGPALSAALIVAVGSGWSIAANALAILVGIGILLTIRTSELHRVPPSPRRRGQIREAVRYIGRKPALKWTMLVMIAVATFGSVLPTMFTGIVRDQDLGAGGLGIANSLAALGSLLGALAAARSTSLRLRGVVLGTLAYGAVLTATGLAPALWLLLPMLVLVGYARLSCTILGESLVQLSTNPGLRGRIMSFWALIWLGGQAVGGPVVGWLAETLGAQNAMAISGFVILLSTFAMAVGLARSGGLRLRLAPAGRRMRRPVIVRADSKA